MRRKSRLVVWLCLAGVGSAATVLMVPSRSMKALAPAQCAVLAGGTCEAECKTSDYCKPSSNKCSDWNNKPTDCAKTGQKDGLGGYTAWFCSTLGPIATCTLLQRRDCAQYYPCVYDSQTNKCNKGEAGTTYRAYTNCA